MQRVDFHFQKTSEMQSTVHITVVSLECCMLLQDIMHSVNNTSCIPGQEWTLHGHSTYLTDCIELGHSGAMHPANVKHSTDTMQGPQIQVLSKLKDIQEIY